MKTLFVIDNATFSRDDEEMLHFIYALELDADILLLNEAVILLNLLQQDRFAKKLNAAELFGISHIFASISHLKRYRITKHIPITRLKSLERFFAGYQRVIKL